MLRVNGRERQRLFQLTKSSENVIVTDDEIAEVATAWTRVPVTKMSMDESVVLQDIDKKLTKSVIGQDVSVQASAISPKSEMWISE